MNRSLSPSGRIEELIGKIKSVEKELEDLRRRKMELLRRLDREGVSDGFSILKVYAKMADMLIGQNEFIECFCEKFRERYEQSLNDLEPVCIICSIVLKLIRPHWNEDPQLVAGVSAMAGTVIVKHTVRILCRGY